MLAAMRKLDYRPARALATGRQTLGVVGLDDPLRPGVDALGIHRAAHEAASFISTWPGTDKASYSTPSTAGSREWRASRSPRRSMPPAVLEPDDLPVVAVETGRAGSRVFGGSGHRRGERPGTCSGSGCDRLARRRPGDWLRPSNGGGWRSASRGGADNPRCSRLEPRLGYASARHPRQRRLRRERPDGARLHGRCTRPAARSRRGQRFVRFDVSRRRPTHAAADDGAADSWSRPGAPPAPQETRSASARRPFQHPLQAVVRASTAACLRSRALIVSGWQP